MEQTEYLGVHVPPVPPWFLRLCQGNFEPSHIAQTENEKSSSILAQVGLNAQLCTQRQSLLMVLVMLGQLLNLAKLRVDRLGLDYSWCNLFPWELAKLIDTT